MLWDLHCLQLGRYPRGTKRGPGLPSLFPDPCSSSLSSLYPYCPQGTPGLLTSKNHRLSQPWANFYLLMVEKPNDYRGDYSVILSDFDWVEYYHGSQSTIGAFESYPSTTLPFLDFWLLSSSLLLSSKSIGNPMIVPVLMNKNRQVPYFIR